MNTGGWLLLSALFGALLFVVQRTETKRRRVATIVMAFVAYIVWRYALYRMSTDCDLDLMFRQICSFNWIRDRMTVVAIKTVNWSLISAVLLNLIFWVFIGRSNPPGSSDSITVFGKND